jgi:hypothetical protein
MDEALEDARLCFSGFKVGRNCFFDYWVALIINRYGVVRNTIIPELGG